MPCLLCFLSPTTLPYCKQGHPTSIQSIIRTHLSICHFHLQNTAMRIFMNVGILGYVAYKRENSQYIQANVFFTYFL